MRVYVAGKMEWLNAEDSVWRESLGFHNEPVVSDAKIMAAGGRGGFELVFPNQTWFDHGGDLVEGIVEADIGAVEMSDAVIAVFTSLIQVGTLVELLHAVSLGKKCLAVFMPPTVDVQFTGCPFMFLVEPVRLRCVSNHYWFLINYLLKFSNAGVAVAKNGDAALMAASVWLSTLS